MRTVTIRREKSFVACLAKMKVYVEDHVSPEITVGGVPCRKLGTLKNGEMESFQVEEQELKIFVIADTFSKEFCNEFYQLPEGDEYVSLSGKNRFNPASGNAFRFNDNQSEGIDESRRRGVRIGAIVLIVALIIGMVAGAYIALAPYIGGAILGGILDNVEIEDKTFEASDMRITLTNEFRKKRQSGYEGTFYSKDVAVFVLREGFGDLGSTAINSGTKWYAEKLIEVNDVIAKPKSDGDKAYFEYTYNNPDDGETYYYVTYVYKSNRAFWAVQFVTLKDDADRYSGWIGSWARTVKFAED